MATETTVTESRAVARHVRVTPQKARRVVELIRGKNATDAVSVLRFAPQGAAEPIRKVLESAIANARATLATQDAHGSLASLVWSFEPARKGRPVPTRLGDLTSTTPESTALSKELRKLGFRFVGPTTAYAAMQSLGLVNDHLKGCWVRAACERDRRALSSQL